MLAEAAALLTLVAVFFKTSAAASAVTFRSLVAVAVVTVAAAAVFAVSAFVRAVLASSRAVLAAV